MQETVLLYNIDKSEAGKAIISILEKLNVKIIIVKSSDLMNPIGYILGEKGFERGTEALTTIPNDDMLVMAGFEDKQIDILLQIFKEANIPFIPLKAIVTQTNVNWTFMQLLNNVKNEYFELTGMNKDKIN
ncbi:DUF3783 domain-containing protein [Thomasclavelia cocleata]|jgi:hypothetical protein|uniref:DUF3783 domain-containing protein n=2 Tax=Thomasclavelia cocleata TaxID=69824 RepID=A0A1I0DVQ3_9FIRM|nr:DUF3783 domain-containing protein [Thomasclavelia cocleata]MCI9131479.1 DUF3783 domain-containing protein [Thomasclavelia cocleata]MCI9630170.1 DUF3783 domain-containing protein [Thomasclavelia cocleata]MCR1961167.1 DUF3783 domain-containing protein [Thomasclavelia cocleata]NDO42101.1 DUF3783 domain-containing protein [Thomasclavelia cocleata]PJN80918.1 DUF3783 domain-containing protein [Thomasclavelia cocleata]